MRKQLLRTRLPIVIGLIVATGCSTSHTNTTDLRHAALVTNQTKPYTIALLERAISTGIDNTGASLSPVMPRWKLSKQDLQAVAHYVFTQLK